MSSSRGASATTESRRGCRAQSCVRALLVVAVCGWVCASPWSARAAARNQAQQTLQRSVVVYRPPVDAPVSDPFRPPATPYGPGNRGIEYATVPGTLVRAAADGLVVFAGPVAGGLHVTIRHLDGVLTSYSFLAAIRIHEGQAARGGDVVGVAAALLHVGARRDGAYIDPASLWGSPVGPPEVHLVPLDGYPQTESHRPPDHLSERRRLAETLDHPAARLGLRTLSGVGRGIAAVASQDRARL